MYGRDDEAWNRLTEAGLEFLVERAQLRRLTSYTELNAVLVRRTGLHGFDFSQQKDRAAMGYLLGRVVEASTLENGLMISSLVIYLDGNDAGPGFYALAQDLGKLPREASSADKEAFWVGQVNALFDTHAPSSRRQRELPRT